MPRDPYQPCPCGSGQKLRWCCQNIAKWADKAESLAQEQQWSAALQTAEEGLRAEPGNRWLRLIRASVLASQQQWQEAETAVGELLRDHPNYGQALLLRMNLELGREDLARAANTLQDLREAAGNRPEEWVAGFLRFGQAATGRCPVASFAHLRLLASVVPDIARPVQELLSGLERDRDLSPWLKDSWRLRGVGADDGRAARWHQAMEAADTGHWRQAMEAFRELAAESPDEPALWWNLGLCRAWLARDSEAASALHRCAELEPDERKAIDAEALAQCLLPLPSAQTVEVVRDRFPIRDHSALVQKLKDHPLFSVAFLDAEEGPVRHQFLLADRPVIESEKLETVEQVAEVCAVVNIADTAVEIEYAAPEPGDTRLATFLEAVGEAIDGQQRQTARGMMPVSTHQMSKTWVFSAENDRSVDNNLVRQLYKDLYCRVWPETPLGVLDNHTPRQAAGKPGLKRPLQAAVLLLEHQLDASHSLPELPELRAELGLPSESAIAEPECDVDRLPLARLRYVDTNLLEEARLTTLFRRAKRFNLPLASERAAEAIVTRVADKERADTVRLAFATLFDAAVRRRDRQRAQEWIGRARQFDSACGETGSSFRWDIAEWTASFHLDQMNDWGPRLAQLLDQAARLGQGPLTQLMATLASLGLVQFVPDPMDPQQAMLDTRLLAAICDRYRSPTPGIVTPDSAVRTGPSWTPRRSAPPPEQPPGSNKRIWMPPD